jgi:NADPH:quinone reductase-like Zn-dependent oxidoreductase
MAAALNRRDYWITQGMYPDIRLPVTLGSDGAGVVEAAGSGVDSHWLNREVVINPSLNWGDREEVQAADFQILGMPADGTFATHVVVPASALFPRPQHLNWPESAALPLAGLTAYRAVHTHGGVRQSAKVLVTGAGGGVATFAVQFATAAGAEVCVTSSAAEKIAQAQQLGARCGFLYTDDDWHQQCLSQFGPPDVVIDGTAGAAYGRLVEVVAPGGRIVNYGATAGAAPKLDMFKVFWKQLQLRGTTMGSPADFAAMLRTVEHRRITPTVDAVLPLAEGNQALANMAAHTQFGKLVLST